MNIEVSHTRHLCNARTILKPSGTCPETLAGLGMAKYTKEAEFILDVVLDVKQRGELKC